MNTANEIYVRTLAFLTRLSARYARLVATPTAELAGKIIDHTEAANKIYPSDDIRRQLRKQHLLEAQAALSALDVRLAHCYEMIATNPQGAFTTGNGKTVHPGEATKKLDDMSQILGELIDQEEELIRGVLESDRKRK